MCLPSSSLSSVVRNCAKPKSINLSFIFSNQVLIILQVDQTDRLFSILVFAVVTLTSSAISYINCSANLCVCFIPSFVAITLSIILIIFCVFGMVERFAFSSVM